MFALTVAEIVDSLLPMPITEMFARDFDNFNPSAHSFVI